MLLTSRSGFQNSPSPRSPDTTGNPHSQYGSRSVKPVKWGNMVIVAELVKRLIVVQEIVGSSPIFHT
jgi:hypothetical protein